MRDLVDPLGTDPASAQDVFQERPHIIAALWSAEGDEEHRIEW